MQPQPRKGYSPANPDARSTSAASDPDTSLDGLESKRQLLRDTPEAINSEELKQPVIWVHRGWTADRDRIRAALARTNASRSRIDSWDGCGGSLWIVESNETPGTYQIRRAFCHDRLCRICGTARAHQIGRNLRDKIANRKHRLITLTLFSTTETLTTLLDKLYQAFYDLRRSKLWRGHVRGGVAFLEVKFNRDKERWHPHLHVICEGSFMLQADLAREWHRITGDSFIADIRLIRQVDKAVEYVTKYASKPLSSSFVRVPSRLDEAVTALHGRRLASTFGTWRGWKLTETSDAGSWSYVCSMYDALEQARQQSPFHVRLLLLLNAKPDFQLIVPQPRPPPPAADPTLPFATTPTCDYSR